MWLEVQGLVRTVQALGLAVDNKTLGNGCYIVLCLFKFKDIHGRSTLHGREIRDLSIPPERLSFGL